ncbi:MAG: helix-turn-helix domain-containing protein, partial [Gammaproteobacteria bacterium]|nr:helix-turn-helix domain-containing protein [Gammaproteobacteria bacterium]
MMNDYQRIAKAIEYLSRQVEQQPTLDEVAAHVHLSAFHFQRLFCQWAGISPKRFLQVMTLEKAKPLVNKSSSLLTTSERLGLSSPSRLYDHFVLLEAVTPGEFKSGGMNLRIDYGVHQTPFGGLMIAQTPRGVCRAAFVEHNTHQTEVLQLSADWPNAEIVENQSGTAAIAKTITELSRGNKPSTAIPLHVKGTNFQVAVWRALLSSGSGDTLSYSDLAD